MSEPTDPHEPTDPTDPTDPTTDLTTTSTPMIADEPTNPTDPTGADPTEQLLISALAGRATAGGAIDETAAWHAVEAGIDGGGARGVLADRAPFLAVAAAVVLLLAIGLTAVARRGSNVDVGPTNGPDTTAPAGALVLDGGGIGLHRFGYPADKVTAALREQLGEPASSGPRSSPEPGSERLAWGSLIIENVGGRFAGWAVSSGNPPMSVLPAGVALPDGLSVGMSASSFVEHAPGHHVDEIAEGPALCTTGADRICAVVDRSALRRSLEGSIVNIAFETPVLGFAAGSYTDFSRNVSQVEGTGTTMGSTPGSTADTTPPDTTPEVKVELHGDGIDSYRFGADLQPVIDHVTSVLGPPTQTTDWSGPGLYDFKTRGASWGALSISGALIGGRGQFAGYSVSQNAAGDAGVPAKVKVPYDLELRITAAQFKSTVTGPLTQQGAEGADLQCFADRTGKVCAAFDPPWNNGPPITDAPSPTAVVVAYTSGLGSTWYPATGSSTTSTSTTVPSTGTHGIPAAPQPMAGYLPTMIRLLGTQPAAGATGIDVQVNYGQCSGDLVPTVTASDVTVGETDDAILITIYAQSLPPVAYTCQLPEGTRTHVSFSRPVGARKIYVTTANGPVEIGS